MDVFHERLKDMGKYKENNPDNFYQIRWLDNYMDGHKGFIAGGCFKNVLSGETVKDIDIFFECENDFNEAVEFYESKENTIKKYENKKAIAFQKEGSKTWVELIKSIYGTPEQILRNFDFTITKMAYFKRPIYKEDEELDELDMLFNSEQISGYEYCLLHHKDFFEHLHMKRLVIDENIPFPISTWERTYRYKGYGFNMCREAKKKLLEAIKKTDLDSQDLSMYNIGGWD